MAIHLTQRAAQHIRNALAKKDGIGLRLGIKTVGCSGLAYTFDYANEIGPEDEIFESHDVKVVVNRKDLAFMDGSTLDLERQGLNEVFKVKNPKAIATCGCGESFTVESAA
ncbi:MAG: iron-sulfur cluster assembly accessory protein [Burkholderiales bacterium]|nr:iron-sulfur cluster assembly accessory protein [Burkholderiales bacterium]